MDKKRMRLAHPFFMGEWGAGAAELRVKGYGLWVSGERPLTTNPLTTNH